MKNCRRSTFSSSFTLIALLLLLVLLILPMKMFLLSKQATSPCQARQSIFNLHGCRNYTDIGGFLSNDEINMHLSNFSGMVLLDSDEASIKIDGNKNLSDVFNWGQVLPFSDVVFVSSSQIIEAFCKSIDFSSDFSRIFSYLSLYSRNYLVVEWKDISNFTEKQKLMCSNYEHLASIYTLPNFIKILEKFGVLISSEDREITKVFKLLITFVSQCTIDNVQTVLHSRIDKIMDEKGENFVDTYRNADPFPHVVIDNILPYWILHIVSGEIPSSSEEKIPCRKRTMHGSSEKDLCTNKGYVRKNYSGKLSFSPEFYKPCTWAIIHALRSEKVRSFLSYLSGVENLLYDPDMIGAGVHLSTKRAKLDIHVDFNRFSNHSSPRYKNALRYHRRVNTFIFLNPEWKDSYEGHLQLWNGNKSHCGQNILPSFGRMAIFTSNDFSYHGHPIPLNPPNERLRRSIAQYYYTIGDRPTNDCISDVCPFHSTIYDKSLRKCEDISPRRYKLS